MQNKMLCVECKTELQPTTSLVVYWCPKCKKLYKISNILQLNNLNQNYAV